MTDTPKPKRIRVRKPPQAKAYTPPPRTDVVERHIPSNMDHSLVKHWTADIPASRLEAFRLPSIVNGRRVYPGEQT